MLRLIVLLVVMLFAQQARAEGTPAADQSEFQRIITAQIEAFRADDGMTAYSHAAPIIKQAFPSPETFMGMVKKGYMPVYRPQSFRFREAKAEDAGQPRQRLTVVGPDGQTYEAVYTFERQPDGGWKINGCYLNKTPGLDA